MEETGRLDDASRVVERGDNGRTGRALRETARATRLASTARLAILLLLLLLCTVLEGAEVRNSRHHKDLGRCAGGLRRGFSLSFFFWWVAKVNGVSFSSLTVTETVAF